MIFDRLQTVFREVFDDPQLVIQSTTTADDIRAWDSLTHLELIASVEEEFKVKFSFEEVMHFHTVGDLFHCITKKIHG